MRTKTFKISSMHRKIQAKSWLSRAQIMGSLHSRMKVLLKVLWIKNLCTSRRMFTKISWFIKIANKIKAITPFGSNIAQTTTQWSITMISVLLKALYPRWLIHSEPKIMVTLMTSLRTILWCLTSMTSIAQTVRMTTLREAIITSKRSNHTCRTICISKNLKLMSQINHQAKWVDTIWKVCWQEHRIKDTRNRLITMASCHKVCHRVSWQPHRHLHHHTRINYQLNMSIIGQSYTGLSLLSIRLICQSSQVTIRWLSLVMVSSILTLHEPSRPKICKISGLKNRLMKLILLAITLCFHRITIL